VLSTPPAFVLSQNQTLQTKTTHQQRQVNPNQKNLTKQPRKTLAKKSHPNTEVPEHDKNKQQTKTTKHTIEFSNNTPDIHARPCNQPAVKTAYSFQRMVGTIRNPESFPQDAAALCGRTASQRLP
jgi:hypothetical protein